MFSKLKFINFVVLLFIIGTCTSNPVDLTCEYSEISSGLAYIAGSHYKCNLETESFALDSVVGEVFGEHIPDKLETDVDVLFIVGQGFFKIPNMKEIFNNLVYLHIDTSPMKYLKAEHLSPYGASLKVLIIKNSMIEIIEKDSISSLTSLTALDLRGNMIFYIHPDAFISLASLALTHLLLDGNDCKNGELDIGPWDPSSSTNLAAFLESLQETTCGTIDSEKLVTKYLLTNTLSDIAMETIEKQAIELSEKQFELDTAKASLTNVTNLFNEISLNISEYESQIIELNETYEECLLELDDLNSTFLSCNETMLNLTDVNDNLTSLYEEANSTISSLELTILNLNSSNIQLKSDYDILNQSYVDLKIEADELKSKIDEIDVTAEKCREVDGTCRFTNGTNGYTCIAHDVNITAPGVETTTIEWTGTHLTNSKNRNVLALLLRELDVHYMPTTIGTTFVDIKVLTVQKCGLKKLSKGDFNDLVVLKTLEITSNNIESIDSGVFDSLTSLESLDLSENKIKLLPSKVFVLLPQLKNLNLDKNELTSLKADFLASSTKIEYFSAINNQLAKVESSFVWKMRNAKKIDLTGNGCGLVFDISLGSYITFYSAILSKC